MKRHWLALGLLSGVLAASSAAAAPIEILARLDPGQSGPVYSWSLLISVQPGYDVGAVGILTRGFDSFVPNAANPGIGILDTAFTPNYAPEYPDFGGLVLNNTANGVAIAAGGSSNVLLGTFYSTATTAPPVGISDGEFFFGGTVFDTYLRTRPIDEAYLSAYPVAAFSLAAVGVPEPGAALLALAALGAGLRTARRLGA